MPKLEEVFGISTQPVLSYIERPQVDGTFKEALGSHPHIVIYGSSKQGKTALRERHLADDQCTIIRCGTSTTPETIYQALLRDAGVRIEVFEQKSDSISGGAKATVGFKASIPWIGGAKTDVETSGEKSAQSTIQSEYVGYNFRDAQAITELLREARFKKFVVLENFHYLPIETQQAIAFDLKTFHEVGVRFIVLGIWQEANLLLLHNGDLAERVQEIPVEPWESHDFDAVILKGSRELNVIVPHNAKEEFKKNSYGNIGMLQEFVKTFCIINDVDEMLAEVTDLKNGPNVERTFEIKLSSQRGRLYRVLEGIAGKSRPDGADPLILPYYLVKVLLTSPIEELHQGISRQNLLEKVRHLHHRTEKETIRGGDITHLLKRLPDYQQDIQPPFLYYDRNQQRLRIVDTSQFFVLSRINRNELLEEIPYPLERYED